MCSSQIQKRSSADEDFLSIVMDLFRVLDSEDMALVATLARCVWLRRNGVVFGRPITSPASVLQKAREDLAAFQNANVRHVPPTTIGGSTTSLWLAPPVNFVKVNWDAAVDIAHGKMEIGVVIRNSNGEVLASLAAPKASIIAPDTAEAMAALKAVSFSRDLGFTKVVLEGDALSVVQGLRSPGRNYSRYGHLIEEARSLLNGLQHWSVNHVRRHLNEAAHRLAKQAVTLREAQISIGSVPLCISDVISMECCT